MKRVLYVYYGTLGLAGGYIDGIVRAASVVHGLECHFAVSAYYRFPARGCRLLRIFFPCSESTPENPLYRLRLPNVVRLPLRYLELCVAYALLLGYVVVWRIEAVNASLTDDYLVTSLFVRAVKWLGVTLYVTAHDSTPYGRVVPGRRARIYERADRVVVHYPHVREALAVQHGVPREKVVVHTNPGAEVTSILAPDLHSRYLAEARERIDGATRVILFIGVLRPEKGLSDLLDAWIACRPEPDDAARLVVAGKPVGSFGFPGERRRDIVFVRHYLASEEFQAWMDEADVVVLPYAVRWYSHSAILIMAALASKPVLASDIPLFRHLVTRDTGWLFRAGDLSSLSTALGTIISEPLDRIRAKGTAARSRVLESWRNLPRELVDLYEIPVVDSAVKLEKGGRHLS